MTAYQAVPLPGVEGAEPTKVHPFAGQFPMMSDEDLQELAADIKANGQIHPIMLDGAGQLIDGRNRERACELADVVPHYATLPPDVDPYDYIVSANVERRHLTPGQRAMAKVQANLLRRSKARQNDMAEPKAGVSQQLISEAAMVSKYAPALVPAVMAGGSLAQAADEARARKGRQEADARTLKRLRQDHPTLAAQVDSGALTLAGACAAADALARDVEERAAIARLERAIALAREEIGEPSSLPPEPDLALRFTPNADGEIESDATRDSEAKAAALEREHVFLQQILQIKRGLQALAAAPVLEDLSWREGHLNAVRSAASGIVAAVYDLVRAHEAALADRPTLREVK